MKAQLRTTPGPGGLARRSRGPLRSLRAALALAVLAAALAGGASLLIASPTAGARGLPDPQRPPWSAIVVVRDEGVARAEVTELMPGIGGELQLVDVDGRVVDRAPLLAGTPAELAADVAGSYRLRFRQEAATSSPEVSASGLAMTVSAAFDLDAGEVVVAEVAPS